jgi:epoxyqueuosine reductase
MKETIREHLAIHGYHGRVVSIGHLQELEEEIRLRYDRGLLDKDLYQAYLSKFDRLPPGDMPDARSLIVVAYADPPVRFAFSWRGRTAHVAVPPTYLNAQAKDAAVGRLLAEGLTPEGYRVAPALAPKKLPPALIEKMRRWDLLELYDQLPRNLTAFLERVDG